MVFKDLYDAARIWVKGDQFTIANVLGRATVQWDDGQQLADRYQGGSMVIARLAPQDYHRWRMCRAAACWAGACPSRARCSLSTPWPSVRTSMCTPKTEREIISFISPEFGKVLIVPVGAVMVGSITILKDNCAVQKGEQHGYFQFGGSTVLLFFEPNTIEFDRDLLYFSSQGTESLVRVNTRIGVSVRGKPPAAPAAATCGRCGSYRCRTRRRCSGPRCDGAARRAARRLGARVSGLSTSHSPALAHSAYR